MTTDVPSGQIAKQPQTESPLAGYSDTLVDDTTILVDGSSTLVGSQSTPITPQRTKVSETVYRPSIKVAR